MARDTRKRPNPRAQQQRMASMLDDLTEFNNFREEILPVLREALKQGADADTIYRKFQAYAAARAVSIAATELDSGKALSAIKDILDRTQGRAKERTEVVHKMENLTESQLDAILLSKMQDQNIEKEDTDGTNHKH